MLQVWTSHLSPSSAPRGDSISFSLSQIVSKSFPRLKPAVVIVYMCFYNRHCYRLHLGLRITSILVWVYQRRPVTYSRSSISKSISVVSLSLSESPICIWYYLLSISKWSQVAALWHEVCVWAWGLREVLVAEKKSSEWSPDRETKRRWQRERQVGITKFSDLTASGALVASLAQITVKTDS